MGVGQIRNAYVADWSVDSRTRQVIYQFNTPEAFARVYVPEVASLRDYLRFGLDQSEVLFPVALERHTHEHRPFYHGSLVIPPTGNRALFGHSMVIPQLRVAHTLGNPERPKGLILRSAFSPLEFFTAALPAGLDPSALRGYVTRVPDGDKRIEVRVHSQIGGEDWPTIAKQITGLSCGWWNVRQDVVGLMPWEIEGSVFRAPDEQQ